MGVVSEPPPLFPQVRFDRLPAILRAPLDRFRPLLSRHMQADHVAHMLRIFATEVVVPAGLTWDFHSSLLAYDLAAFVPIERGRSSFGGSSGF